MRRALIACGGTGGHLAPGIALAEELLSRGCRCRLLISEKQVDSRLARKYSQFEYQAIAGRGLSWRPIPFGRFAWDLLRGYRDCVQSIRSLRPDIVVGFGGFISASALLAGARNGIPVAIHEANQVPGRVTRLSSRYADRVYLPEGVELSGVAADRVRHVGLPLRAEFKRLPREEAKRALEFEPGKKLLLVLGGSQGAQSLNEWARASADVLGRNGIQLLCLTGLAGGAHGTGPTPDQGLNTAKSVFLEFSDEMATLLSAADLAVSRAGAGSLAELIRCRVPSILIPYPHAADDHQLANAKRFEENGGGKLWDQNDLPRLLDTVLDWAKDDGRRARIEQCLAAMDRPEAQSEIADDLGNLAKSGRLGRKEIVSIS